MSEYADRMASCDYSLWHPTLQALSFRTRSIPINPDEIKVLLAQFRLYNGGPDEESEAEIQNFADAKEVLWDRIDEEFKNWPDGAMIKCGQRSCKDIGEIKCFRHTKEIFDAFCQSERWYEELEWSESYPERARLYFREWTDIPIQEEWRCFWREGKLIGISQYDYFHFYPHLSSEGLEEKIRHAVDFWSRSFGKYFHRDLTFDLWIQNDTEVKLIELNPYPYGLLTDPCMFKTNEPPIIGELPEVPEFRIRKE